MGSSGRLTVWCRVAPCFLSYVRVPFCCHGRGRGFEPRRPRHITQEKSRVYGISDRKIRNFEGPKKATNLKPQWAALRLQMPILQSLSRNDPYNPIT